MICSYSDIFSNLRFEQHHEFFIHFITYAAYLRFLAILQYCVIINCIY